MIVRAFLGPLAITFLIVVFVMVMQFLWLYVDDFMGKGLEWYVMTELLVYAAASFVPIALPLAILLAGIMTMGALGENSELIPMRSAGLGVARIMLPLLLFTGMLTVGSYFFSNDALPVANLKFKSLLWDLTEKKPALNIKPGVFYNGIDGFSIRVMEKDVESGELKDILIYDHRSSLNGNGTVIRAERGTMMRSTDGHFLVLTLENGKFYDEQGRADKRAQSPLLRGTFKRDVVTMDLSGLSLRRTDEELFKENYKLMTMSQLASNEDSLLLQYTVRMNEHIDNSRNSLALFRRKEPPANDSAATRMMLDRTVVVPGVDPLHAYDLAMNMARNHSSNLAHAEEEMAGRRRQMAKFRIEWHRKPMLAITCLVFLLIGAPLGAIIRKGGMGLPVVVSIVFFILFRIISFSTEKLVVTGELPAWLGMWMSTIIFVPIGLFLTWKAAVDSPLFDRDAYHRGWERFRSFFRRGHARSTALQ